MPRLGFEIDPHEGFVGDLVAGQVDVDDVAEHCVTDPEVFLANMDATADVFLSDEVADAFGYDVANPQITDVAQVAYFLTGLVPDQIDLVQATDALPSTFVMAFADLESGQPIDPMGNFDPATGEGEVVVPEVAPGIHPVIAACVQPSTDPAVLIAAAQGNLGLVEDEILPLLLDMAVPQIGEPFPPFPWGFNVMFASGFLFSVAVDQGLVDPGDLVAPFMEPQALGFEIYCVLDADGICHPDLRNVALAELLEVEDPDAFLDVEDRPAVPVGASPRFTG